MYSIAMYYAYAAMYNELHITNKCNVQLLLFKADYILLDHLHLPDDNSSTTTILIASCLRSNVITCMHT